MRRRRFFCLSFAMFGTCVVMMTATLLAHASNAPGVGAGWWIPQEVSQSAGAASKGPRIVVDGSGGIHLIWMDDTLGQPDLYYVRSGDQGNGWSDAERISTTPDSYQGSLALGSGDTLHACWWEFAGTQCNLLYAQRTAGGWSPEETVVPPEDSDIQEPSIAEASDYIHVVWSNKLPASDFDLYFSRKSINGSEWLTPTVVADTDSSSLYARMAVDTNGDLHLVWQENISPTNEIMYISGTVDAGQTTWFSPITVSTDLGLYATTPDIVVGHDDVVQIVFAADVAGQLHAQDVYYARFPMSNTGNISPTVMQGSRVVVSQQLPTWASPSIALDGENDVHVVWNGMKGDDIWDRIYYAMSEDQGLSWSPPIAISIDDAWSDGFPTIATDGTLAHVAWQQKASGTDNDIYYAHSLSIIRYTPLALKDYQ